MTETPESREGSGSESIGSANLEAVTEEAGDSPAPNATDRVNSAVGVAAAKILHEVKSLCSAAAVPCEPPFALSASTATSLLKTRNCATLLAVVVGVVAFAVLAALPITWTYLYASSAPTAALFYAVTLQALAGVVVALYAAGLFALAREASRLRVAPTIKQLERFVASQLFFWRFTATLTMIVVSAVLVWLTALFMVSIFVH